MIDCLGDHKDLGQFADDGVKLDDPQLGLIGDWLNDGAHDLHCNRMGLNKRVGNITAPTGSFEM